MQTAVTDPVAWSVSRSVELIEMPLGLWVRVGSVGNHALDRGPGRVGAGL